MLRRFPILAALPGVLAYCYAFFHGGSRFLEFDCRWYNLMARGETAGNPFNSRILVPALARLIHLAFGVDTVTAFHIITPVCLLLSLIVLSRLLRAAPVNYQKSALGVFALHVGVVYGQVPVVVDPLLLLLVCLTVIYRERSLVCLLLICIAVLVKDYAGLLLIPWSLYNRRLAWLAVLPVALTVYIHLHLDPGFNAFEYEHDSFLVHSLMYYPGMALALGPFRFFQHLLIKLSLNGFAFIVLSLLAKKRIADLTPLPVCVLGDVDRSLHIVQPAAMDGARRYDHPRLLSAIFLATLFASLIRLGGSEIPYFGRAALYGVLIATWSITFLRPSKLSRYTRPSTSLRPSHCLPLSRPKRAKSHRQ
jgi:hypothetical protein